MQKKNHFTLLREARSLRLRIEELEKEMEEARRHLAELDIEMLYMVFTFHSVTNNKFNCQVRRVDLYCYNLNE